VLIHPQPVDKVSGLKILLRDQKEIVEWVSKEAVGERRC